MRTYLPQEAVVGDAGGGDEGADEEGERQHEGQDERVGAGRAARPSGPAAARALPPAARRRCRTAWRWRRDAPAGREQRRGPAPWRLPLAAQRVVPASLPYPLFVAAATTCGLATLPGGREAF